LVEVHENNIKFLNRHSSKGNQLKWEQDGIWYKADYTGYEGLSEYVVSELLKRTTNLPFEFVSYETERIKYGLGEFRGCKSKNFLNDGWMIITLERLFKLEYGESLQQCMLKISSLEERSRFLVNQIIRKTGLADFGKYMSILLTIDAFFLNDDRHLHNIAVLWDGDKRFQYCPIFDHGSTLLADTTLDYPIEGDLYQMIDRVKSKTFCQNLEEQLDIIEAQYGQYIKFDFDENVIRNILDKDLYYDKIQKDRVFDILMIQKRKYSYFFEK
jgi:hypothetical protein